MIGEYVLGGNRWTWGQLSLESAGQRRCGEGKHSVISKMFKAGLCSTEIPASWLASYCEQDVRLCRKVFLKQRQLMNDSLTKVMYTRCLLTPVLADIERNGMILDSGAVTQRAAELEAAYARSQQALSDFTGGINVNSPKQLGEYLYATLKFSELIGRDRKPLRTPSGGKRTDADTIARLSCRTKAQRTFVDLFQTNKEIYNELTKYLRKFVGCCDEMGGHLLASFNQTNTRTHRLSSTGLDYTTQFQNFPRAYKPFFRAREDGWLVGEADGAQLEFRVAAHLGRDPVALGDILGGTDIHSVTAGIIGCSRQDAKAHTFKPLYGGRSGTPDEVRYYEFFREKYGGITKTQQSWVNTVLRDKCLTTEWGLTYYWPDTKLERSGYVVNSTSICNYPVQALATAEIIPIGIVYMWHYIRAFKSLRMFIVNTVHDSIIVELPPDEKPVFHALAYVSMVEEVYGYLRCMYNVDFTVPLAAGVACSERWGDGEAKADEITLTALEDLYESNVREQRDSVEAVGEGLEGRSALQLSASGEQSVVPHWDD